MPDPFEILAPLVSAATVRIHAVADGYVPGGPEGLREAADVPSRIWGSGFFVAPGWVITCAHVLIHGGRPQVRGGAAGMRITGSTVGITFNDGAGYVTVPGIVECVLPESYGRESLSRDAAGPAPAPDLALIRLLEPVEHPCVWLSDRSTAVCDRLAYFGCSEQLGEVQDFSGHSVWSGTLGRDGLFRLGNTDEVPEGVSGGPVVDLLRGEVIGVVKARRRDQDGGLAVAVSQLRRLPMPATEAEGTAMDLYVEVLRAHDRYHHERHSDPADGRITWIDAQALLVSTDIGQLNPARRAEMLALLTRIPSPRPGTVSDLVRTVREDDWSSPSPVPAPRDWRDGAGRLYDPPGGSSELESFLGYCARVAAAENAQAEPQAAEALWRWVDGIARDEVLHRSLRRRLRDLYDQARQRIPATDGTPGPLEPYTSPQSCVRLELTPTPWVDDQYDWRVVLMSSHGQVLPFHDGSAVRRAGLEDHLREPLEDAFRECDGTGREARLEVVAPPELFDLAVDEWPAVDGTPLGVRREVVLRFLRPAEEAGEDGPKDGPALDPDRLRRWRGVQAGPMQALDVDCVEGHPNWNADHAWLNGRPPGAVPVMCRHIAVEPTRSVLRRVEECGYGVIVLRRPVTRERDCARFHSGVRGALGSAVRGEELPARVLALRARTRGNDHAADWSSGLALVYDDPLWEPFPGQPLKTPDVDHP